MADIGRLVKYGIGKETVAGTAVAPTNWFNHLSFDLSPKSEYQDNTSAYGVLEKTNDSTLLHYWTEGSMECKLTADTGGLVLLGAFGSVASADNADTNPIVKDHTFTINETVNGQTFTFARKDSLSAMRFALGRIGKWQLDMKLDDYLRFSADIFAKKGATSTLTPAFTDETEFVAKHISVKTAANVAGLSGATAYAAVESFTLTVDPNIDLNWQAGSPDPESITSNGYELKFEMEARYNDQTFETAYNAGTPLALQVTAKNTDVVIGATANPGLVFTAPKMIITDWARSEDLDKPITQKLTGTIHYSFADLYALKAVLTNSTATY